MTEMQRLVDDESLRESAVSSWKAILPYVFRQIELERSHNKRLRHAMSNIDSVAEGKTCSKVF